MDDNKPHDLTPSPDSGKPKREPPTIDLEASEVTSTTASAGDGETASASSALPPRAAVAPWIVAAGTGAVSAAVIVAVAWALGGQSEPVRPIADASTNAIETMSSRVAVLEGKLSRPIAPDVALSSRLESLEKSVAGLKTDIAGARARANELATEIDTMKSTPVVAGAPAPAAVDLAPVEARLAEIERMTRAESDVRAKAASKPVDDPGLRRVVVASMLDIAARQGEPYVEALSAAKSLVSNPDTLKPLDRFAGSGVPNAASLCRDLLTRVPKLEPPSPADATAPTGIVGRLQAGAAKLVRIERTDAVGNDRGAIVARLTAAALRNDLTEARRELSALTPADRAPAQDWLDKADARDAALSSAHRFAAEAMAMLAKPTQ